MGTHAELEESDGAGDLLADSESAAMGRRFRVARGKLSQRELAELVSVHPNTIGKIERGHDPGTRLLIHISRCTQTSASWLLTGDSLQAPNFGAPPVRPAGMASNVPRSVTAWESGEFVYVPHFDIRVSAGNGAFNDVESVIAMRPFDVRYIRQTLGIVHNEIALTDVQGRSMEPLLHSGDTTMLDRRDRDSLEGEHIIRLDGALFIKTLQRLPGRVLRVASRNPEFAPFEIALSEDSQRDFEVVGRIRWAGVTF